MDNFEEYFGQQIDERMYIYEEVKDQVYNEALLDYYNEIDKVITEFELLRGGITYNAVNDLISEVYERLKR